MCTASFQCRGATTDGLRWKQCGALSASIGGRVRKKKSAAGWRARGRLCFQSPTYLEAEIKAKARTTIVAVRPIVVRIIPSVVVRPVVPVAVPPVVTVVMAVPMIPALAHIVDGALSCSSRLHYSGTRGGHGLRRSRSGREDKRASSYCGQCDQASHGWFPFTVGPG